MARKVDYSRFSPLLHTPILMHLFFKNILAASQAFSKEFNFKISALLLVSCFSYNVR